MLRLSANLLWIVPALGLIITAQDCTQGNAAAALALAIANLAFNILI